MGTSTSCISCLNIILVLRGFLYDEYHIIASPYVVLLVHLFLLTMVCHYRSSSLGCFLLIQGEDTAMK